MSKIQYNSKLILKSSICSGLAGCLKNCFTNEAFKLFACNIKIALTHLEPFARKTKCSQFVKNEKYFSSYEWQNNLQQCSLQRSKGKVNRLKSDLRSFIYLSLSISLYVYCPSITFFSLLPSFLYYKLRVRDAGLRIESSTIRISSRPNLIIDFGPIQIPMTRLCHRSQFGYNFDLFLIKFDCFWSLFV